MLAEAEAQVEERRAAMIAEVEERRTAMIAEMEEHRVAKMAELEEEKNHKRGLDEPITIEEMVNEGPPEKRARKVGLILDMLKNAEPFTADEIRPALRARVRWLLRLD